MPLPANWELAYAFTGVVVGSKEFGSDIETFYRE